MLLIGQSKMKEYLWNILISLDQFANTVFNGNPDETISSRWGKHIQKGKSGWRLTMCKALNFFDKDHCIKSIEDDEGK